MEYCAIGQMLIVDDAIFLLVAQNCNSRWCQKIFLLTKNIPSSGDLAMQRRFPTTLLCYLCVDY